MEESLFTHSIRLKKMTGEEFCKKYGWKRKDIKSDAMLYLLLDYYKKSCEEVNNIKESLFKRKTKNDRNNHSL